MMRWNPGIEREPREQRERERETDGRKEGRKYAGQKATSDHNKNKNKFLVEGRGGGRRERKAGI